MIQKTHLISNQMIIKAYLTVILKNISNLSNIWKFLSFKC